MNRQERRKQGIITTEKSRMVKESDYQREVEIRLQKQLTEVFNKLSLAFAISVMDELELKDDQLIPVMNKCYKNFEAIGQGYLSYSDLERWGREIGLMKL